MNRDRDHHTRADQFYDNHPGSEVELAYAGINTFLKATHKPVDKLDEADVGIVGVPYDGAVSNRPGTRYGPDAIRRASGWWAYLSGYKGGLTNMQTGRQIDFSDVMLVDCGDVPIFPMDIKTTAESIESHVATVAQQAFPILLGGDHYCTYPSFCGFAEGVGADHVGLVQIDAHTDTNEESAVFGEHFHGSSTHQIASSEYCDYEHISQVAIRGYETPSFFEFSDNAGLNLYTMRDIERDGIQQVIEEAVEAAASDTDVVYVTFDIDGVDPSVAPGTGTPVPGGLTAHQALRVMETLGTKDIIGGVDMMEVAPTYDPTENTERLAAYLLVTFLERRFAEM